MFYYFKKNYRLLDFNPKLFKANLLFKIKQKLLLQALQASKKKITKDLLTAKNAQIVAF